MNTNISINQLSIAELRLSMIIKNNVSLILDAAADQFATKISMDANGNVLEHFYKYTYYSFISGFQTAQDIQNRVEEHETK